MNDGYDNKKIMSKNLKKYMEANGKTRNDICDDLSISYSTFADWFNGKVYPRIDKIERLASYFSIDKSDLIEDKFQVSNEHSGEYSRLTDLCNINFKSVMTWTEDSFYKEYETIALRDHISDFLIRYKFILEALNGAKLYWNNNKEELIEFYRKRDSNCSERQIKEMYLKQELEEKLNDAANWVLGLPGYIAKIEDQYVN